MRRFLTGAGAVALVLASNGPAHALAAKGAPPAPNAGWRVVKLLGLPPVSAFADLAVAPTGSAWAVGAQRSGPHQSVRPLVHRLVGTDWREVYLPKAITAPLTAVAASSSKNVWAFGARATVIRWNGQKWTQSTVKGFTATDAATTGGSNVWAVDGSATARHWNGKKWLSVKLPARATAIHAVSPTDIWAAGSSGDRAALIHGNGRTWKVVQKIGAPTPGPAVKATFQDVTVSGKAVWATGAETGLPCNPGGTAKCDSPLVLRVEGTETSITVAPGNTHGRSWKATTDGSGGLWAIEGLHDRLVHYTADGTVDGNVPMPDPGHGNADTTGAALANRPGTRTVWGIGLAFDAETRTPQGMIMHTG